MKQLIIIGEGKTEQDFCKDVLQHHFLSRGIIIHTPTIKKTSGGIVSWSVLREEIENYLTSSGAVMVTTLIDYYGIHDHHEFPSWEAAKAKVSRSERMDLIEEGMKADLNDRIRYRFIPYVQLHEFEALLFSDGKVFDQNFEPNEFLDYDYLQASLLLEPEDINDGRTTAPSKRLERIIRGYKSDTENNKVFYGSLLAHDIGLQKIRSKCPRFNAWIAKLENI